LSHSHLLRVSTIRSQNPKGIGGCIFTGVSIDEQGNSLNAAMFYVVRASAKQLAAARVQVGQWWQVVGEPKKNILTVNGYQLSELQIEPDEMALMLPSGEHIVTLMAESADFHGVGQVKARKLWETFRERLYDILDQGDVEELAKVLPADSARQVVAAWAQHGNTRSLQWLHQRGFEVSLGRKVLAFFGAELKEKLEEDPYRLLSFSTDWHLVDKLARTTFGVAEDDPRRLTGAIEEALYRIFSAGHTSATFSMVVSRLEAILGRETGSFSWRTLVPEALDKGFSNGSYLLGEDCLVYPLGPYVMESIVARAVANRLEPQSGARVLTEPQVEECIANYEVTEQLSLNAEQRLAVHTAVSNAFALITGGAGVGKTTVLKCLYAAFDMAGVRVYQMALAGRAAKRMQEATGRTASTLASFLKNSNTADFQGPTVVVVDEASMVDIITMSRLCEILPPHVRIVLVGDPSQLMPVGPGLILHTLVDVEGIPTVELKEVKRHGGAIAAAAADIRAGRWPVLPDDPAASIAFLPRDMPTTREAGEIASSISGTVLDLYLQNPVTTQILSSRRNGPTGTHRLNALCQQRLTAGAKPLRVWNNEHEAWAHTGFHLGDPVLCTRNLWNWGLQNGSLGRLAEIEDPPRVLTADNGTGIGTAIAWVDWDDGERRPVLEEMLDDLELGYAITVHKAQGSQWARIIVAVTGNRLLDRTLVYTAVTRARRQVVMVGDVTAASQAVISKPTSDYRRVGLGEQVRRQLALSKADSPTRVSE